MNQFRNYEESYIFSEIPAKKQTKEMCLEAVQRDGYNIQYVANRFLSEELCLMAIQQNSEAFMFLEKRFISKKTILAYVNSGIEHGEYISLERVEKKIKQFRGIKLADFIDIELAKAVVSASPYDIAVLPNEWHENEELIEIALRGGYLLPFKLSSNRINNPKIIALAIEAGFHPKKIRKELLKNEEVIEAIIKHSLNNYACIPRECFTPEIAWRVIEGGAEIYDIPQSLKTKELWGLFAEKRPERLYLVPSEFLTQEMVERSFPIMGENWNLFENEKISKFLNKEIVEKAVSNGAPITCEWAAPYLTGDLIKIAIELDYMQYVKLPAKYKTEEISEYLIEQNATNILLVPLELQTDNLWLSAIKKNQSLVRDIPRDKLNEALVCGIVELSWEYLYHIPQEFITPEIAMRAFNKNPKALALFEF